jgi:hypothetical protein
MPAPITYPTLDDWIALHMPALTRVKRTDVPRLTANAWNHGNAAGHAAGRDAAITQALALVRARLAVSNCTGADALRILETQLPKVIA